MYSHPIYCIPAFDISVIFALWVFERTSFYLFEFSRLFLCSFLFSQFGLVCPFQFRQWVKSHPFPLFVCLLVFSSIWSFLPLSNSAATNYRSLLDKKVCDALLARKLASSTADLKILGNFVLLSYLLHINRHHSHSKFKSKINWKIQSSAKVSWFLGTTQPVMTKDFSLN